MTALVGDFEIGVQPLWPPAAVTIADFFDRPSWERPTVDRGYTPPVGTGGDVFTGTPGFGGTGGSEPSTGAPGFSPETPLWVVWTPDEDGGTVTAVGPDGAVTIDIVANRRRFYSIEVYDNDGDRVTAVPEWISGKLTRKLDQASTLEFRIAHDAEGAADLVRPNQVWLRDRWGFVLGTFQIQRRKPNGTGDASYIDFVCQGAIGQLAEEVVISYDGGGAGLTVQDHIEALLALQSKTGQITLGTVDDAIGSVEMPFFAVDTTIHAALLQLQTALTRETRGRFYVDPKRRLQWRLAPGDSGEQVITRKRNVYSIESEIDYTALVNRIYLYGEGQDAASRLSLTDAGEAEDYIQNAPSVALYDVQTAIKVDRRIRHPETLLRVAQRILEEFATPPVYVSVEMLDLAKADDAPTGWADIEIGGLYRVVDSVLGIDQSIEIVGIETSLEQPVPLRVELANQRKNLGDLISRLVDALEQPLDVDGERYPTMGRNYTAQDPRSARAGDTRWNTDRGQMHDGAAWQDMGGGGDPSDVEGVAIVSLDPQAGTLDSYARADHEHLGQPFIAAATKAALPSSGHADGVIGYTTDTGVESPWFLIDGAWIAPVMHLGTLSTLPAIPTGYAATVRFSGQLWCAGVGDTYWTPMQRQTTKSGAPGTTA